MTEDTAFPMIETLSQYHEMTPALVYIAGLLIVAWLAYLFASRVLLTVVRALASRTTPWTLKNATGTGQLPYRCRRWTRCPQIPRR